MERTDEKHVPQPPAGAGAQSSSSVVASASEEKDAIVKDMEVEDLKGKGFVFGALSVALFGSLGAFPLGQKKLTLTKGEVVSTGLVLRIEGLEHSFPIPWKRVELVRKADDYTFDVVLEAASYEEDTEGLRFFGAPVVAGLALYYLPWFISTPAVVGLSIFALHKYRLVSTRSTVDALAAATHVRFTFDPLQSNDRARLIELAMHRKSLVDVGKDKPVNGLPNWELSELVLPHWLVDTCVRIVPRSIACGLRCCARADGRWHARLAVRQFVVLVMFVFVTVGGLDLVFHWLVPAGGDYAPPGAIEAPGLEAVRADVDTLPWLDSLGASSNVRAFIAKSFWVWKTVAALWRITSQLTAEVLSPFLNCIRCVGPFYNGRVVTDNQTSFSTQLLEAAKAASSAGAYVARVASRNASFIPSTPVKAPTANGERVQAAAAAALAANTAAAAAAANASATDENNASSGYDSDASVDSPAFGAMGGSPATGPALSAPLPSVTYMLADSHSGVGDGRSSGHNYGRSDRASNGRGGADVASTASFRYVTTAPQVSAQPNVESPSFSVFTSFGDVDMLRVDTPERVADTVMMASDDLQFLPLTPVALHLIDEPVRASSPAVAAAGARGVSHFTFESPVHRLSQPPPTGAVQPRGLEQWLHEEAARRRAEQEVSNSAVPVATAGAAAAAAAVGTATPYSSQRLRGTPSKLVRSASGERSARPEHLSEREFVAPSAMARRKLRDAKRRSRARSSDAAEA